MANSKFHAKAILRITPKQRKKAVESLKEISDTQLDMGDAAVSDEELKEMLEKKTDSFTTEDYANVSELEGLPLLTPVKIKPKVSEEVLDFCEQFSKRYKTPSAKVKSPGFISIGSIYESDNGRLKLHYIEVDAKVVKEKNMFLEKYPPAGGRVNAEDGQIEINKSWLCSRKLTQDFVFSLILWLYVRSYFERGEDLETDAWVFDYCRKKGKNLMNILSGWKEIFKYAPSKQNAERMAKAIVLVSKKTKKK